MSTPRPRPLAFALIALAAGLGLALSPTRAAAQEPEQGWPREIATDSAQILIYQPQPDELKGIALTGRAAVSVTKAGATEPVFGILWFTARSLTDRDQRTVDIDQVAVTEVRFVGITPEQEALFKSIVNPRVSGWSFTMALDRLEASLADAAIERRSADSLNTTPPAVIFSKVPAALLLFAGEPVLQPIPDGGLKRVVNTPMFVVFDSVAGSYYLNGGPLWYSAKAATGPWKKIAKAPAPVSALVPDSIQKSAAPPGEPPKIIVATTPTELIVTSGEPSWSPITGTDLLYVSNTERDVFKDIKSQKTFVLLSGRWFSAPALAGPWAFVHPDSLPATFKKIPPASPKADVLASVAGTSQASDAVLDAQIPQTAAIDRRTAKVTVVYDGEPKFEPIPGTGIETAVNTQTQVLKIGARYYACDQAVWFTSIGPKGPWSVSDSVPKAVETIPPSSPAYNVKYVEIYQATPTVVYVGYTPGYMWGFPYYGTMVYGTGFYYPPYVGPVVYYPRPVSYGVAVRYNPWTGWTVGFGYSTPFMHVGVVVGGPHYGGWYGPYGRPPYPPPYYRPPYGGYPGYRPPPPGYRPPAPGYRPPAGAAASPYSSGNNMYRQPSNQDRVVPPSATTRDARATGVGGKVPNNVVAGQDGSVYRKNGDQWQSKSGSQWQDAGGGAAAGAKSGASTQPGVQPKPTSPSQGTPKPHDLQTSKPNAQPSTRPSSGNVPSDVSRDMQSRDHGQQRTQDYNRASSGASKSSQPKTSTHSAPRGGGGGRRP